jgi:trans-L-3-hydroxyproline dehydratase
VGRIKRKFPPRDGTIIETVEAHTGGEPLRIVVGGLPAIPGDTILAKRRYAQEHLDPLRRVLMWEPRGHADMYGAFLTEPVTRDGDVGVLFLHNNGFSTMCGHGIIALATVLIDLGMVDKGAERPQIRMDTPAGRVVARAHMKNGRVEEVSFENVPSFVYAREREVEVPGIGRIGYDVAFGGAFYAMVDSGILGIALNPGYSSRLIDAGKRIKEAVADQLTIEHPQEGDLGFLYGTLFVGPPRDPKNHSRNACIFADGELDRSPTGTGVSARLALLFSGKELALDEPFTVESILGTCMTGRVVREMRIGPYPAVIPEVRGSAYITGLSEWWIDPADPLGEGFLLR